MRATLLLMKWQGLLGVLAMALGGCSSDGGGDGDGGAAAISDAPLSGEVGGEPWTFASGESDSFLSDESGYFVQLYAQALPAACEGALGTERNSVLLNVPTQAGQYRLGQGDASATLFVSTPDGGENYFAQGSMTITELSAARIVGGVSLEFDADNHLNGQFEATLCP